MIQRAGGVASKLDPLCLLFLGLALLPLFLRKLYGDLGVNAFISDAVLMDFMFKMVGLASVGFLIPIKELRYTWWVILLSHFLTKDALFKGDASFYLLNIVLGLLIFYFVFKDKTGRLFQYFCFGVLLSVLSNFALQLLQIIQADPFHTFWKLIPAGSKIVRTEQVACGFLGNPVTLGVYYSICLPLLLVSVGKWFPLIAIPVLFGVILTHSKIALLVCVITFMILAQLFVKEYGTRYKRLLEIAFFSFIALIPFSLLSASSIEPAIHHRWILWTNSMTHLTDPIFGDGLSSWRLRNFWFSGNIWPQACNEYVQAFYELGALGLGFIGWYLFKLFKRIYSASKSGLSPETQSALLCVSSTLLISFVFFPLHIPQTAAPFIVSLAYLERSISHVGLS